MRPHRGPARAKALLRDLGLLPAGRGHASALRQGGARGPALVGPAAGFSHGGPGAGEGPAGQERRDRAGRGQGRLRAEAAAAPERPAGLARGRNGELQDLRPHAAPAHGQHRGRPGGAAGRHRAARRRRPLSRGRRRQGHRDLLGHRQRRSRPRRATGSATPSPPAAARATTTRPWASRRGAPGRR